MTGGDLLLGNNAALVIGDTTGFTPGQSEQLVIVNNSGSGATVGL